MKFAVLLLFIYTVQSVKKEQSSFHSDRKANCDEQFPRRVIMQALETGVISAEDIFEKHLRVTLLRNLTTRRMSSSDLAMWISAIISAKKNPCNQEGVNLVADLGHRVDAAASPLPFEVLTLCNAGALEIKHLEKLLPYTNSRFTNSSDTPRTLETQALALKAFACAFSVPNANEQSLNKYLKKMTETAKRLKFALADGIFENIYTTSLITQALTAFSIVIDPAFKWNEKEALQYLREHSTSGELTKAYYISMALNSRRVPFLKDLHKESHATELSELKYIHVLLSLRNEEKDVDFAMMLRVPSGWTLFQIMLHAADFSYRFKFSWTENKNSEPVLFQVDNTPNDPERGLYWVVCSATPERTNGFYGTPTLFVPHEDERITLWYRRSDCPRK